MGAEGFEPPSAGFHHGGSYPPRIVESSLQSIINCQQALLITLDNWSPPVCQVSLYSLGITVSITSCATLPLSFFFSFSFCAISNAGFRVSSRRVSFFSCYFLFTDVPSPQRCILWRARRDFRSPVRNFRTRGVWLRRPALYPG